MWEEERGFHSSPSSSFPLPSFLISFLRFTGELEKVGIEIIKNMKKKERKEIEAFEEKEKMMGFGWIQFCTWIRVNWKKDFPKSAFLSL